MDLLASVYAPPPPPAPWRLEDWLGPARVRYFSFGRRALARALGAVRVKRGDAVLLPAFLCRDVLSALAASGARAVWYPVDERLAPAAAPGAWPEAKAVLAVDYFGWPSDLSPFREYAARTGAAIIEDNAHGLFSRDEAGIPLGLRGDLGILSLRKTLALPNGAALLAPEGSRWDLGPQDPFAPPAARPFKEILRPLALRAGAPAALAALDAFRRIRGRAADAPDAADEVRLPLPELPCSALGNPLAVGDPGLETTRRRALYPLVEGRMSAAAFPPIFPALPPGTVPYAYAFRCPPEAAPSADAAARPLGLRSLPWPDLPAAVAADAPAHYRDVRLLHFLW